MSATPAAHELIEGLVTLVRGFLPAGYYLGYELIHTNQPDAERIRGDQAMKANWRERLGNDKATGKRGASAGSAARSSDATTVSGTHVLFEVLHIASGLQVIRTVPMDTLIALATEYQTASASRKTQLRNAVQAYLSNFYTLCQARVAVQ